VHTRASTQARALPIAVSGRRKWASWRRFSGASRGSTPARCGARISAGRRTSNHF
jgi:hypothetical protein